MKATLLLLLTAFPGLLIAQIERERPPRSQELAFRLSTPVTIIDSLNPMALRADAQLHDAQDGRYRIGKEVAFKADPTTAGRWFRASNGDRFWTLRVKASNAQAVSLLFDQLILPRGSELYAYSANEHVQRGAFTERNNQTDGWIIAPIRGDEVVLEYWAPARVQEQPVIELSGIAYHFRGFEPMSQRGYGDAGSCQINVNCQEGDDYTDPRNAVVRIILKDGSFFVLCTGTLVNTTRAGCDPYILLADHCAGNASVADFAQWTFYFNYQAPTCADPGSDAGLDGQTMVGCSELASTGVRDLSSGSDFLLVELDLFVPPGYEAYYAGWTRTGASNGGVCIHHPSGDLKKISTFSGTPQSTSWAGPPSPDTHWSTSWISTANGHGTTEGGSSGAPLMSMQGLVYGMLSGGFSSCNILAGADLYGKFSTAWDSDGNTANRQLAPWLDPISLNPMTIPGTYPPCKQFGLSEHITTWRFYPNPAVGHVTLELPPTVESVRIADILGRNVWSTSSPASWQNVSLEGWPGGMYFVQVLVDGQISSRMLIVQ